LRAVALASGFKRGEFIGDTKLSPTIIRCHHHHRIAHEKIGPPHIRLTRLLSLLSFSGGPAAQDLWSSQLPNLQDPLHKNKGKKQFYPSQNVHPMDYLIHIDAMRPDEATENY
jgi:hypothetical protein